MKTLFTCLLAFALVFSISVGANAETFIFGGGGTDFKAFNSTDGYNIEKNWGYSGGFAKTLSPKVSAITTYDYVVTKATDSAGIVSNLYENEVFVSVAYLLNSPESKLQFRILAGIEYTDGNIPDYSSILSFANGFSISYVLSDNGMSVFGAGNFSFSEDYYDGKLRVGITYPVGNLIGGIL